jgi:hypothetical protein
MGLEWLTHPGSDLADDTKTQELDCDVAIVHTQLKSLSDFACMDSQ